MMVDIVLNPEHENLYKMITKQKKKCDDLKCKANDGQGFCRIDTCALINPEKALVELKALRKRSRRISWLWKCPICNAIGKKPTAHYLALKRGKFHGRNVHNNRNIEPIFIRYEGINV